MMNSRLGYLCVACLLGLLQACGGGDSQAPSQATDNNEMPAEMPRTVAPPGAAVFFITPGNGDVVSSPLALKFGISGMAVVPAGDSTPSSGHHHLLVNAQLTDLEAPVPKDDAHRHFGKGQTETTLELPPGEHVLQLVMGDANHVPHDPPIMSKPITVTVE